MKLDTSLQSLYNSGLPITSHPFDLKPEYEANSWVKLLQLPNPFSDEEALLLCQQSEDEWVAWVPNHGETILRTNQFCHI